MSANRRCKFANGQSDNDSRRNQCKHAHDRGNNDVGPTAAHAEYAKRWPIRKRYQQE